MCWAAHRRTHHVPCQQHFRPHKPFEYCHARVVIRESLPQGRERDTLTTRVEQHFNQLTVFDPRVPHGVATVEGVREPTESRVVLHGWFTSEGPFFSGAPSYDHSLLHSSRGA